MTPPRRPGLADAVVALALVLLACSTSSQAAPSTTTTPSTATTVAAARPTTIFTTTTEPPNPQGEGFHTRRKDVLIVGTDRLEPPWFIGASAASVATGLDHDLASEIARRLNIPAVQVIPSSLVLMATGQDCKCDVMLGSITISDDKARHIDLTEPYLAADQGVLVRDGSTVRSIAEAGLLRWGVVLRNSTGLSVLADRIQPTRHTQVFVNEADELRALADGRIDAVLVDTPQALAIAAGDQRFVVAGQFRTGEQYAIALSLGSPNTALLNEVIRGMRDDGTIDYYVRWYLHAEPPTVPVIAS